MLCTVHCTLKLSKPRAEQREIRYRKLRSVDMSALSKDLRDSIFLQENITDLPTLVGKYETELARVFDIHAPEKKTNDHGETRYCLVTWTEKREKDGNYKGANHAWLLTENYTRNNAKSSVLLSRKQRKTITPTSYKKMKAI